MKTQVIDKQVLKTTLSELVQSDYAFIYQLFAIALAKVEAEKMEKLDAENRKKALRERYMQLPPIQENTFIHLRQLLADTPPAEEWAKSLTK